MHSNLPSLLRLLKTATPNECLLWPFGLSVLGYGRVTYLGKRQGTHSVAYQIAIGPIPAGHEILHRCDNPPCFNPFHLSTGSHVDNVLDMWEKGRGWTKLNKHQVAEIKQSWPSLSYSDLAAKYEISTSAIHLICTGKKWNKIPFGEPALQALRSGKRTQLKGMESGCAKITDEQVLRIRSIGSKIPSRTLAKQFGIGKSTIGSILRRETWCHL